MRAASGASSVARGRAGEGHAARPLDPADALGERRPEARGLERHPRAGDGERQARAPLGLDALVAHAVAQARALDARERASVEELDARAEHIEADVVLRGEAVRVARDRNHLERTAEGHGDGVRGGHIDGLLRSGEGERADGERGGSGETAERHGGLRCLQGSVRRRNEGELVEAL
jgi:hypothetical protein